MFRGLFKKDNDEVFETVDPIVEQRRKEKFSKPLMDASDFDDEEVEKKVKTVKQVEKKVEKQVEKPKEKPYVYQMSQIISPMTGVSSKGENSTVKPKIKKVNKPKRAADSLVPVISPFYGDFSNDEKEEEIVEEEVVLQPATKKVLEEEPLPTVEDNLRNIAKIIEEEKNQLKIIEERTGEFKLDYRSDEDDISLIDEIDDEMSLDDLMSRYENKFSD